MQRANTTTPHSCPGGSSLPIPPTTTPHPSRQSFPIQPSPSLPPSDSRIRTSSRNPLPSLLSAAIPIQTQTPSHTTQETLPSNRHPSPVFHPPSPHLLFSNSLRLTSPHFPVHTLDPSRPNTLATPACGPRSPHPPPGPSPTQTARACSLARQRVGQVEGRARV